MSAGREDSLERHGNKLDNCSIKKVEFNIKGVRRELFCTPSQNFQKIRSR